MLLAMAILVLTWAVMMPLRFSMMKGGEDTPLTLVLKGLPTAAAAGIACWSALNAEASPYALWMALGLLICLAADVVLGIRFVVGGGLFLLGHICYIIGLMSEQTLNVWHGVVFAFVMIILQVPLIIHRRKAPNQMLAYGVCVYATALAGLLAAALPMLLVGEANALPQRFFFFTRPVLAAVGAVLFVVSDATLCDNIVNRRPVLNQYISLGIYYTAQFLLGMSTLPVL